LALFVASLSYYGYAALQFPTLFNLDNPNNFVATQYLVSHHKLPVVEANNTEIFFSESGTSRLSRPPFTYIVSAVLASVTKDIVKDRTRRLRLGSPLIGAIAVVVIFIGFWLAFGQIGLALLGTTLIGLLPKFVFLASSNNDDIGAILSVSAMFTSIIALFVYRDKTWVLFALAISLGVLLLTKYTAWLTLPWFAIFSLIILKRAWPRLIRLAPALLAVCIAAGGWWLIFNMVNYGIDDPSGYFHIKQVQHSLQGLESSQQGYHAIGMSLIDLLMNQDQFISKSYKSFTGYLEWLDLEMGFGAYLFYGFIFCVGIVGAIVRLSGERSKKNYLDLLVIVLIVGQGLFFIHHNLVRDIQPQGRYLLPIIMPMVYLFLHTLNRVPATAITLNVGRYRYDFQVVASTFLFATCLMVYVNTLNHYIIPSFIQKPYYIGIKHQQDLNLESSIKIVSATSINHRFVEHRLELDRTGIASPALMLDTEFCKLLPINALLSIVLWSPTKGDFQLRLDRNHAGSYDDIYWHGFPAGKSTAVLTINATNCTGAKITLGRNTYKLVLENLQIGELRIHQYGKPI
jgi:4-amino-4-deoxy-L-arabinose transferase-like glycosyltransferase